MNVNEAVRLVYNEQMRPYNRAYYARNRERICRQKREQRAANHQPAECQHCGDPCPRPRYKFCSQACHVAFYNARKS